MSNFRRALKVTASSVIGLSLACGVAGAVTLTSFQPVTGTLTTFSTPPNQTGPGGTPNSSVSFAGYSQTAANAAIAAACPVGFICSTATFYEIDFGLNAATSGTLSITNTNGSSQTVPCITPTAGWTCSGKTANGTNGVGAEGDLTLNAYDPLGNDPFGGAGLTAATFSVSTNTVTGTGSGKVNLLTVAAGTTTFSGTGTVSASDPDFYDSADAGWGAEATAYSAPTVSLTLFLQSGSTTGQPLSGGLGTTNNIATINSGALAVDYDYSYTETQISSTPEPTTFFLLGTAFVGVGLLRKRVKA